MKLIDRIDSILKEDLATLPSLDSGVGASEVPDEFDVEMEPIEEGVGGKMSTVGDLIAALQEFDEDTKLVVQIPQRHTLYTSVVDVNLETDEEEIESDDIRDQKIKAVVIYLSGNTGYSIDQV